MEGSEGVKTTKVQTGNSGHIFPIDDGKFRLTFVSTTPGGASFSSEIGDLSEWEIREWLKDHLYPGKDLATLFQSVTSRAEMMVPIGQTLMTCHWDDDGGLVKSPATAEEVCQWLGEYQKLYFGDGQITISVALLKNKELKATAGFCPSHPRMGSIMVSSELLDFNNALRISLLHELVHANLLAEKGDADDEHGEQFKSEVKCLLELGAYDTLL